MSGVRRWHSVLGWSASVALAVVVGLVAARYLLLDSTAAVIALGVIVTALIVAGLRAGARMWEDE